MRRSCILYVVGSRFGLGTMAPVIAQMQRRAPRTRHVVVAAGDNDLTEPDLIELGLEEPDYRFDSGSTTPVTAATTVMERIERVVAVEQPNLMVVSGNSTAALAAALTALRLDIRHAKIDAGLRNFDRHVSGEINRVIIDSFADLLFVGCEHGMANLRAEGIDGARIHLVGSTMVDTLNGLAPRLRKSTVTDRLDLVRGEYLLVALRESTLSPGRRLAAILDRLVELSATMTVVLPVPDSVREAVARYVHGSGIKLTESLGYLSFLALEASATAVLTDRGGIQAETTHFGRPCFTLLGRTARTTTLLRGTNRLLGSDPKRIAEIPAALREREEPREMPPFWDGRAADRVADVLTRELTSQSHPPPVAALEAL